MEKPILRPNQAKGQAPCQEGENDGCFFEGHGQSKQTGGRNKPCLAGFLIAIGSFAMKFLEKDAGGDPAANGGGLIRLRAHDGNTSGPETHGNCKDTMKPIGGRLGRSQNEARAGRQQCEPDRGDKKSGEQMESHPLPHALAESRYAKEYGAIEAEPSMHIRQTRHNRVRLHPANRLSTVQAGVEIIAGAGGAESQEQEHREVEKYGPAGGLQGRLEAIEYASAIFEQADSADAAKQDCQGGVHRPQQIPSLK